nr:MAG TPA: hypothetical protein [Inoviridae sp.]
MLFRIIIYLCVIYRLFRRFFFFFCGHRFAAGLASFGLRTRVTTLIQC